MLQMFLFFLKLGFISFGGGYALIPMIENEAAAQHWMTSDAYVEAVAVAGMSPGPIAINLGTIIGYETYGIGGAVAALAGLIIPSILVAALVMLAIYRFGKQAWIDRIFYGLQPVVAALILFAVYRLGVGSLDHGAWGGQLIFGVIVIGICWMMLVKYKMHPVFILIFSAVGGAAFFA
ncbi:chromate transporter [Paenibacillus sp. HB172176]|uniref:chromate transporter n=1 Tax=Paenibacillus sp. HB172176 TaxID=2493690 RepID=UPI00143AD30E|nr:chromate transporter [Paenibacillus sp. HB172176]